MEGAPVSAVSHVASMGDYRSRVDTGPSSRQHVWGGAGPALQPLRRRQGGGAHGATRRAGAGFGNSPTARGREGEDLNTIENVWGKMTGELTTMTNDEHGSCATLTG